MKTWGIAHHYWSHVRVSTLTCVDTSTSCHVSFWFFVPIVALTIFRMAAYQFNMLRSPLESVPVLHHGLSFRSRWLHHIARRHHAPRLHTALLSDIFLPLCTRSSRTFIKQRQKKCTNKKDNIIKRRKSFLFIWALGLHASHLFRGGKLIQFAVFASSLIQRPLHEL